MNHGIDNHDKITALFGKRVRVTMANAHYTDTDHNPPVICEGELLGFGDGGDFEIREDDGFVHYCWPMLDIEEVKANNG